jgi:hypothetical protein
MTQEQLRMQMLAGVITESEYKAKLNEYMNKSKYTEGLQMDQFKKIEEISRYNYNYYVGFEKDLLFGKSDDDNTTEWWIISNGNFYYLGESYANEDELLHLYDSVQT